MSVFARLIKVSATAVLGMSMLAGISAHADTPLRVYGPGGPAPAMKAAAVEFTRETGVQVQVVAGPLPQWADSAHRDADMLYSGSEDMMSSLVAKFGDEVDAGSVTPLYMRPAVLLVRPGNPHHIGGIADLMKSNVRLMVVNGAGQTGLWEDIAGRDGDISKVKTFRRKIAVFAPNTGAALKRWKEDPSIDAWLAYNIWAVANPGIADVVQIEPDYRLYRDCGMVLTRRGAARDEARQFATFLASKKAQAIFAKYGWGGEDVQTGDITD
ncbi:substrate-binding domain-containing protein [Burkholderia ambifaria]|uniref:substrate-binding domain-containing protein n=1 Tax=Burkholderia ambifaria TaxID=152480 RepID=UPI001FC7D20A|nr:substrate-binding domain-containing protein [Burkholderia ambifaria]